jgi:hypothetical protein
MTPEQRARRMVGSLPLPLQSGANIAWLFRALGGELEVMERGITRLMRSRWYTLAEGFAEGATPAEQSSSELARLAELLDLLPARGESADYFRRHLAEFLAIHATGLTTAPAILQLVSFVYLADQPPEITWEGDVAVGTFTVTKADGTKRPLRVELADNPPTAASARFLQVGPGQRLLTANGGLEPALLERISLTASQAEIAVPILTHIESSLDVLYVGRIPVNKTLTLRQGLAPLLDGVPADGTVILASPTRFVDPLTVNRRSRFDAPDARFSVFNPDRKLPTLPAGETHWRYDTLDRKELAAYLSGWPDVKAAIGNALEVKSTPPLDADFRWTEITPASFALRIPVDYVPPRFPEGLPGLIRELAATLKYGRAAGVQTRIELTLPMPAEIVTMQEGPAQMEISTKFAEALPVTDALTSFGPSIEFHEQVEEPKEHLSWSAFFNTTRFNSSRFQ